MSDGDSQRLIGTVLQDSYCIDRLIGEGGMGAVFEGTQLRLNRRVAIKVMSRELTSNLEALGRFRREAELTVAARPPEHRPGARLRDGAHRRAVPSDGVPGG
jgi:hypothetical protein